AAAAAAAASEITGATLHGVTTVRDPGSGLAAAIALGIATAVRAHGDGPVAVLLGDVPAMAPSELAGALSEATRHPLALVPDAEGLGSVLITALRGSQHTPAFGAGSRASHLAAGYTEIDLPADSGLRRDVDLAEHLAVLAADGRLGQRTARLIAG
ncbi:MAG: cofC, partial [Microbacteriaceae bacterium]|nr:cofC [Microbacteriaceae bacterium]